MNIKRIHQSSIVLTLVSLLLEVGVNQGWVEADSQNLVFGASLGLILIAMGLNVKVIRTMGVAEKSKKTSQFIMLLISVYAFLVYALEVI